HDLCLLGFSPGGKPGLTASFWQCLTSPQQFLLLSVSGQLLKGTDTVFSCLIPQTFSARVRKFMGEGAV
ncbi:MAG: hypothetical protein K6B69_02215, partial [Lachnospiraceae bacterium]|nr:hypothetical protein [Lachnospiraceae bacterium]